MLSFPMVLKKLEWELLVIAQLGLTGGAPIYTMMIGKDILNSMKTIIEKLRVLQFLKELQK